MSNTQVVEKTLSKTVVPLCEGMDISWLRRRDGESSVCLREENLKESSL